MIIVSHRPFGSAREILMRLRSLFELALLIAIALMVSSPVAQAKDNLTLVLMVSEDPIKEAPKYEALSLYIRGKSEKIGGIKLEVARDYPEAAQLFRSGKVQGMFSGSFVAGVLIKKGLAKPLVRPEFASGVSTYKALVIAKKGTPAFKGISDFTAPPGVKRKIIAYCAIASSGEVYVRSLLPPGSRPDDLFSPFVCPSHEAALQAVNSGVADYAVVKNLLWDAKKFPGLEVVGTDELENPNMTLLLTPDAYDRYGDDLMKILLGVERDTGEGAGRLKSTFGCRRFLPTSASDYVHTFFLMEKAHVDARTFDFVF
jgi:ABC-type phosphate/phosphonate transport system substrate-binding protein